jgi:hypothetical protein
VIVIVQAIAISCVYGMYPVGKIDFTLFSKINIPELLAGLNKILRDVRFMLNMGLGIYWKFTWCIFIPFALLVIFVYAMVVYKPMQTADGQDYPAGVTGNVNSVLNKQYLQVMC